MELKYSVNVFDKSSVTKFKSQMEKFAKLFESDEFKKFIGEKCLEEVKKLSAERINNISAEDVTSQELSRYYQSHQLKIEDDYIIVYNNSKADLSEVSERTLANYPSGISLAKIVEFGTGIPGTSNSEFDWATQVNPNRDYGKGWIYSKDGQLHFTRGLEGRFIYNDLRKIVEKNFKDWVKEYIKKM